MPEVGVVALFGLGASPLLDEPHGADDGAHETEEGEPPSQTVENKIV